MRTQCARREYDSAQQSNGFHRCLLSRIAVAELSAGDVDASRTSTQPSPMRGAVRYVSEASRPTKYRWRYETSEARMLSSSVWRGQSEGVAIGSVSQASK